MQSDLPNDPQAQAEARLTALLLGELPHPEAAALHQELARDEKLAALYERLKETVHLVRETMASPEVKAGDQPEPLTLSMERREKLLAQFKTVRPKQFAEAKKREGVPLLAMVAAVAIVAVLAALFFPALSRAKNRSQRLAASSNLRLPTGGAPDNLEAARSYHEAEVVGQDADSFAPSATSAAAPPPPPAFAPEIVLPTESQRQGGTMVLSGSSGGGSLPRYGVQNMTKSENSTSDGLRDQVAFGTFSESVVDKGSVQTDRRESTPLATIVLPQSELAGGGNTRDRTDIDRQKALDELVAESQAAEVRRRIEPYGEFPGANSATSIPMFGISGGRSGGRGNVDLYDGTSPGAIAVQAGESAGTAQSHPAPSKTDLLAEAGRSFKTYAVDPALADKIPKADAGVQPASPSAHSVVNSGNLNFGTTTPASDFRKVDTAAGRTTDSLVTGGLRAPAPSKSAGAQADSYFDSSELFASGSGGEAFQKRLQEAANNKDTYSGSSYYRLSSQLGTEGVPEPSGQIHLNYANASQSGTSETDALKSRTLAEADKAPVLGENLGAPPAPVLAPPPPISDDAVSDQIAAVTSPSPGSGGGAPFRYGLDVNRNGAVDANGSMLGPRTTQGTPSGSSFGGGVPAARPPTVAAAPLAPEYLAQGSGGGGGGMRFITRSATPSSGGKAGGRSESEKQPDNTWAMRKRLNEGADLAAGITVDPTTGLPAKDGVTLTVDPTTGRPVAPGAVEEVPALNDASFARPQTFAGTSLSSSSGVGAQGGTAPSFNGQAVVANNYAWQDLTDQESSREGVLAQQKAKLAPAIPAPEAPSRQKLAQVEDTLRTPVRSDTAKTEHYSSAAVMEGGTAHSFNETHPGFYEDQARFELSKATGTTEKSKAGNKGIPVLGDLPMTGRLFRGTTDEAKTAADQESKNAKLVASYQKAEASKAPSYTNGGVYSLDVVGYVNVALTTNVSLGVYAFGKEPPKDHDSRLVVTNTLADAVDFYSASPSLGKAVSHPTIPDAYARTSGPLAPTTRAGLESRLQRIRMPAMNFDGMSLTQVTEALNAEAKKRDPDKHGINLVVSKGASSPELGTLRIKTFTPSPDATLAEVLNEVVKNADRPLKYSVVDSGIVFSAAEGISNPSQTHDEPVNVVRSSSAPIPQPEIQTRDNAFSTFSLNVSDVSFKLAAASLEKGLLPEQASLRSEEFLNAFDYRDPEPAPGAPLAFAWERAADPFAQNRDVLRLSLKTAALGRQAGKPLNLVLLLDNSGSMERADRVAIVREALGVLAGQLQPQDVFSVITFSRTPRLFVDGIPGTQAAKAAEEVGRLTPEGGTNLEEAMKLAYQTALRHYLPAGVNRVVLLTDGAANLGDVEPEQLKQMVEAHRKQGVALDCFGIGWEGYNDDLLETLSRNGDGRYGFVNSPEEASTEFAAQLAGALHVAASDVKVQVEFNPARVSAYRQIGYAKHQLKKEQFRDNTVDAAEIAAAEAGNALYALEVNPAGEGPLATVRVRYKVPGTSDYHEHEWEVPFTGNAVPLDQAGAAMRLAVVSSEFAEWLAASPYATEVSPDALLRYLAGVPEQYGVDGRPAKLKAMIQQAKGAAGK